MFGDPLLQWLAAEYPLLPDVPRPEGTLLWERQLFLTQNKTLTERVTRKLTPDAKSSGRSLVSLVEAIRVGKDSSHQDRLRVRSSRSSCTETSNLVARTQQGLLSTAIELLGGDDSYILVRGSSGSRYSAPNAAVARLLSTDWSDLTRALGEDIFLRLVTDFVIVERVGPSCFIQLSGRVGLEEKSNSCASLASLCRPPNDHRHFEKTRRDNAQDNSVAPLNATRANIPRVEKTFSTRSRSRERIPSFGICRGNPCFSMTASKASAKRLASRILHWELARHPRCMHRRIPSRSTLSKNCFVSLQTLILQACNVPLKRMLDFYCPSRVELDSSSNLAMQAYATPARSVLRFLLAVYRFVVPVAMLKADVRLQHVRRAVRSFLFSKATSAPVDFILSENCLFEHPVGLEEGWRVLKRPQSTDFYFDYSRNIFCFLFCSVIIHTFGECFFVSPAGDAASKRLFMRRDLSARFHSNALNHLIASGEFQRLRGNHTDRASRPLTLMRFKPKPGGFRVIQSMRPSKIRRQAYLVHSVLMYERVSHPEVYGASVCSLAEIHQRWSDFALRWKQNGRPPLFAVCFDIRQAFDSIPLDRLLWHELPKLFHSDTYALKRFSCSDGNFRFPQRKWMACSLENITSGYDAFAYKFPRCSRELIFADEGLTCWLRTQDILSWLRRLMRKNIVVSGSGRDVLIQRHGVPQGLPISSLLCDFHLGQFEKSCFRDIVSGPNREGVLTLMMRYVDDVLFVTTSASVFQDFLARVHQGSKTFGVVPAPGKTRICYSGIGMGRLEWCGMTLDLRNMEVALNTPRINFALEQGCSGISKLRSRLAFERNIKRFISIFSSQIQPIFLDARFNSGRTVQNNISAAMILALDHLKQRWFFEQIANPYGQKRVIRNLRRALSGRLFRAIPSGLRYDISMRQLERFLRESFHAALWTASVELGTDSADALWSGNGLSSAPLTNPFVLRTG